jgi:predicted enzyme related to lactoylglutathione lyase
MTTCQLASYLFLIKLTPSVNKVPEPKICKNRVHIDINLPDREEMVRLQHLGARVLQEVRDAEGRLRWTIMADPEGNEFCAFLPA